MSSTVQRLTLKGSQDSLISDSLTHKSSLSHCSVHSKIKRFIDIFGAIIGLLLTVILAIPIFILMQWDDPGPILYSQMRCGLQGKPFRIWKFRSMVINADQQQHLVKNEAKGHFFKNNKDPRVTNLGYFLRRSSLDEFPQFWNVLRGEMSLVGTRPPTLDEVAKYNSYHWQRLAVKPGLTGEWQVNGRSTITDFEQVVKLDLNYQEKWSILYDLQLIFKTIFVVLSRKGAY
ncbi:sugar transferase [Crocosphaera sp.]|uniref:sugar transferase n=1 Tax=Crocosphaera sp. TaxID=2729996 RepID=UPI003F21DC2C|nr:sugar transferase [Crocosphaera sp.]